MRGHIVIGSVDDEGQCAKGILASTIIDLRESIQELGVGPRRSGHERGARIGSYHAGSPFTEVKFATVILDVIKFKRPEELVNNWVPSNISNELFCIIRAKGQFGLVGWGHAHVERENVPREQTLLNHVVKNREPSSCHSRVSETYDGIIVVIEHMLFYYEP